MTTTQKLIEGQLEDFEVTHYTLRGNEVSDFYKQSLANILEAEIERWETKKVTYGDERNWDKCDIADEEITHLQSLLALLK